MIKWLTLQYYGCHLSLSLAPTNSSAISLNGLTIGSDSFLVFCVPLAANYSFSGYPNGTCDKTVSTGGPADSNGDDQIAIVSCSAGCTSFTILDIYGVPGQQGSTSNGHYFQNGRAERLAGRVTPKSVWNASDWISVYGTYNVSDMTPRKWSGANTVTLKPTSSPIKASTTAPTTSIQPSFKKTAKPTSSPSTAPTVFVNEVADKGDYSVCGGVSGVAGRDWVELYNSAGSPADISGWKLHDDRGPDNIEAYVFPVGTVLAANSYTIFCQADTFVFGIGGYVF